MVYRKKYSRVRGSRRRRRMAAQKVRRGQQYGISRYGLSKRAQCLSGSHPEKKWVDLVSVTWDPSVTGQTLFLPAIAQGATESQRVGRKCQITDILCNGQISFTNVQAREGINRVRLMLVHDTQPNKLVFPTGSVVANGATGDLQGYRVLVNASRFKVLYDRTFSSVAPAGGGDGGANDWSSGNMIGFRINVKCCIDMEYTSNTGAITECTTNSLHWLAFEEKTTPLTTISQTCRIRFVE